MFRYGTHFRNPVSPELAAGGTGVYRVRPRRFVGRMRRHPLIRSPSRGGEGFLCLPIPVLIPQ